MTESSRRSKNAEQLRDILQYIESHYTEKISEADMAERFYLSPAYFSRFFKKQTGITFHDYVITYRVKRAKDELVNTDRTVLEIACDNGFADGRRLSLAFQKIYGVGPNEFRRSIRKKRS